MCVDGRQTPQLWLMLGAYEGSRVAGLSAPNADESPLEQSGCAVLYRYHIVRSNFNTVKVLSPRHGFPSSDEGRIESGKICCRGGVSVIFKIPAILRAGRHQV